MKNLRIAMAQTNVTVGDLDGNAAIIAAAAGRAEQAGADLVLFPSSPSPGIRPRPSPPARLS